MTSCYISVEIWPKKKNKIKTRIFFNSEAVFVGIIPYLVHTQSKASNNCVVICHITNSEDRSSMTGTETAVQGSSDRFCPHNILQYLQQL